MSLTLSAGTLALAPSLGTSFAASGGTAPYVFTVVEGGAGGSINSSTGDYVAPAIQGSDVVQVTDSLGAVASLTIMIGGPLFLFCDIIQQELGLAQGQVYLWDQKINIPTDSKLYVAVGVLMCKPFGNSLYPDGSGGGINAIQSVNMLANLSVDILSRGADARDRKEEIILALQSIYAQSQQEINSFYIGTISNGFVNLSEVDGAAIPYRFNISVNMQYYVRKTKAVPYYDTFSAVTVKTEP